MEKYLKSLNLSKKEIEHFLSISHLRNVDVFKKRFDFLKETFDFSQKALLKKVLLFPALVDYEENSILEKIEFYKSFFNISHLQTLEMIKKNIFLLGKDTKGEGSSSVKGKIKYYSYIFNLNEMQTISLVQNNPQLLCLDVSTKEDSFVRRKIDFYKSALFMEEDQCLILIKNNPILLLLDTESNEKTSVQSKIQFYRQAFKLSSEQVAEMIKTAPSLLNFDIVGESATAVKTKIKYLSEFVDNESIVKNPKLLTHPALRVKLRFMILATEINQDKILSSKVMTTSEDKLWARKAFLKENGKNLSLAIANMSEKTFERCYKVSSKELVGRYPLSSRVIKEVETDYFKRKGKRLTLDSAEKMAVLKECEKF